jgi:uncharacterized repeat protein (TIGR01451 family)
MSRRSRVAPSVLLGPLILSIVYSAGLAVAHLRSTEFAISQAGQLALAGASDLRPLALAKEHARAPGSLHIRVDYALDWVSGETDIGATVAITLTDNGGNVKATAAIQADSSGFFFVGCPNWLPDGCPDLELGDRVHARTDNATAEVSPIGSITAKMDETLDTVEGTLKADWFEGSLGVRCEIWENPGPQPIHTSADPDGGGFWCDFDSVWDLEVGDQVAVLYVEPDGDEVINNPPWPWMRVNYAWDAVGANYELGHTFWITVTDSSNVVKGQATAQSISRGGWQAEAGFDSVEWSPEELDIQPGDLVYIESDDGYTQTVPVGAISATLDIDADSISGQVFAQISSPTNTLEIECHPWGAWEDGIEAPVKNSWATPDGTVPFTCQWDPATEWDIQAGQDVAVMYLLPDRHRIIDVLWKSAPHLRIQKSAEGQPTSGGNFAFQIGYENLGDAAAETVVITDTLPAGLVYLSDTSGLPLSQPSSGVVVWEAGTLDAGARSEFELFVGVNAAPGEVITNIAGIATSSPSDQGEPSEKSSSWTGQIVGNDTHLSVSKSSWTPDAAPGEDLIFELQVCNHGTTGSAEVTL